MSTWQFGGGQYRVTQSNFEFTPFDPSNFTTFKRPDSRIRPLSWLELKSSAAPREAGSKWLSLQFFPLQFSFLPARFSGFAPPPANETRQVACVYSFCPFRGFQSFSTWSRCHLAHLGSWHRARQDFAKVRVSRFKLVNGGLSARALPRETFSNRASMFVFFILAHNSSAPSTKANPQYPQFSSWVHWFDQTASSCLGL